MTTRSMANSTNMPNSTVKSTPINDVLKETELGGFIGKYKIQLAVGICAVIVAFIGVASYLHFKSEKEKEFASAVFQFEEGSFKSFKEGKINPEEFIKSLNDLEKQVTFFSGAVPILLQSSDLLAKKSLKAEAISILNTLRINLPRDAFFQRYFLLARLAALYEDQGDFAASVSVLEELHSLPYKVYESRVYLDLGRLYLKTNNIEKAKSSFQYVIDSGNDTDLAQIARLYMAGIK